MLGKTGLQRLQPPDGCANPICQGRAVELDPLPHEDLALAIKRKVVAILGDQHVSQESRGRQALGDRPFWRGCLVDGPAGPAAVARPADADDPQPCGHVVEHLADCLAD